MASTNNQITIQQLQQLNDTLKSELHDRDVTIQSLQLQLTDGQLNKNLHLTLNENRLLHKQIDDLLSNKNINDTLQHENQQLKSELLQYKINAHTITVDSNDSYAKLQAEYDKLKYYLDNELEVKLDAYQHELHALEGDVQLLQQNNAVLQHTNNTLQSQLQQYHNDNGVIQYQQKIQSLNDIINKKESDNQVLLNQLIDLQTKHASPTAQQESAAVQLYIDQYNHTLNILNDTVKQVEQYKQQYNDIQHKYDSLQSDHIQTQTQFNDIQQRNELYEKKYNITDCMNELRTVKLELKRVEHINSELSSSITQREKQLQYCLHELGLLNIDSDELSQRVQQYSLDELKHKQSMESDIQHMKYVIQRHEAERIELLNELRKSAIDRTSDGYIHFGLNSEQIQLMNQYAEQLRHNSTIQPSLIDHTHSVPYDKLVIENEVLKQQFYTAQLQCDTWQEKYIQLIQHGVAQQNDHDQSSNNHIQQSHLDLILQHISQLKSSTTGDKSIHGSISNSSRTIPCTSNNVDVTSDKQSIDENVRHNHTNEQQQQQQLYSCIHEFNNSILTDATRVLSLNNNNLLDTALKCITAYKVEYNTLQQQLNVQHTELLNTNTLHQQHINSFTTQLNTLTTEYDTLKKQHVPVQSQQLTASNTDIKQQYLILDIDAKSIQRQYTLLNESYHILQQQYDILQQRAVADDGKHKHTVLTLQTYNKHCTIQLSALQNRLYNSVDASVYNQLHSKYHTLQHKYNSVLTELSSYQVYQLNTHDAQHKLNTLQLQYNNLSDAHTVDIKRISELQKLLQQHNTITQRLSNSATVQVELQHALTQLKTELIDQQSINDMMKKKEMRLNDAIALINTQCEVSEADNVQLRNQLQQIRNELTDANKTDTNNDNANDTTELNKQLSSVNTYVQSLLVEIDTYKQQTHIALQQCNELAQLSSNTHSTIADDERIQLRQTLVSLSDQSNDNTIIGKLHIQLVQCKTQCRQYEQQVCKLQLSHDQLDSENIKLIKQIDQQNMLHNQLIIDLQQHITQLQCELNEHSGCNPNSSTSKQNTNRSIESLYQSNQRLMSQVESLNQQLTILQHTNDTFQFNQQKHNVELEQYKMIVDLYTNSQSDKTTVDNAAEQMVEPATVQLAISQRLVEMAQQLKQYKLIELQHKSQIQSLTMKLQSSDKIVCAMENEIAVLQSDLVNRDERVTQITQQYQHDKQQLENDMMKLRMAETLKRLASNKIAKPTVNDDTVNHNNTSVGHSDMIQQLSHVEHQLSAKQRHITELEHKLVTLQHTLTQQFSERDNQHVMQSAEYKRLLDIAQSTIQQLQLQLTDKSNRIEHWQRLVHEQQTRFTLRVEQMQTEVDRLNDIIKQRNQLYMSHIDHTSDHITIDSVQIIQDKITQIDTLSQQNQQLLTDNNQLTLQVNQLQQQQQNQHTHTPSQPNSNADATTQPNSTTNTNPSIVLHPYSESITAESIDSDTRVNQLKQQLAVLRNNNQILLAEHQTDYKSQINTLTTKLATQTDTIDKLHNTIKNNLRVESALRKRLSHVQTKLKLLDDTNNRNDTPHETNENMDTHNTNKAAGSVLTDSHTLWQQNKKLQTQVLSLKKLVQELQHSNHHHHHTNDNTNGISPTVVQSTHDTPDIHKLLDIALLHQQIDSLTQQLNTAQYTIEVTHKSELHDVNNQCSLLQNKIDRLNQQLKNIESIDSNSTYNSNTELLHQMDQLHDDLLSSENRYFNLHVQYEQQSIHSTQLQYRMNELSELHHMLLAKLQQWSTQHKLYKTKIDYKGLYNNLTEYLSNKSTTVQTAHNFDLLSYDTSQHVDIHVLLDRCKHVIDILCNALQQHGTTRCVSTLQHNTLMKQLKSTLKQVSSNTAPSNHTNEFDRIQLLLDSTQKQLKREVESNNKLRKKSASIQQQLDAALTQQNTIQPIDNEQSRKYKLLQLQLHELERRNTQLNKNYEIQKSTNQQLKQQINKLTDVLESIQAQHTDEINQLHNKPLYSADTHSNDLLHQLQVVQAENHALKQELNAFDVDFFNEIEELKYRYSEQHKHVKVLEAENRQLQHQLNAVAT